MDSDQQGVSFPKYSRIGYVDQDRHSDKLLAAFLAELPGDGYLPNRWRASDSKQFLDRYGHLGVALWAASYGSHLLVVGNTRLVRIWTDAVKHCWVEAANFPNTNAVLIPEKNARKSAPFTCRIKITDTADMSALAKYTKRVYGI